MAHVDDYADIARRMKELKGAKTDIAPEDDLRTGIGRGRRARNPVVYMHGTTTIIERGEILTQTIVIPCDLQSHQGGFIANREEPQ